MKILIAPDKMKGSMSARSMCDIIADTILAHDSSIDVVTSPLADGGDGTLDVIRNYNELKDIHLKVLDPLNRTIDAYYSKCANDVYIELPIASGLVLLKDEDRNPMNASTYGTGQLMRHAINNGCKNMTLMLGGSCTNDVGIGILSALGFCFLDESGKELEPVGRNLTKIKKINNQNTCDFSDVNIQILCDVTNPLYGPNGAAYVFARQKGADDMMISSLDEGMRHFAKIVESYNGKKIAEIQGGGAAGGIAAGLYGLCEATILEGFQTIADMTNLEEAIKSSDIVISGEGRLDDSSFGGKVVGGVYNLCQTHHKSLYLFVGQNICSKATLLNKNINISAIESYASTIDDAMTNTGSYIIEMTKDFILRNLVN